MSLLLRRVRKSYGAKDVLKSVDLQVPDASVTAVLGANGAGKTTAIRIIAGILCADSGEVVIDGGRPRSPELLGYLPEVNGLYWSEPVLEQMLYFAELRCGRRARGMKARAYELAETLGVAQFLEQTPRRLSKGTIQRLQVVSALLLRPTLLLLDEPFSGLDPLALDLVAGVIRRAAGEGATILMSTHRMEALDDLCDRFCILREGIVALDVTVNDLRGASRLRTLRVTGARAQEITTAARAEVLRVVGDTVDIAFTSNADVARLAALVGDGIASVEVVTPSVSDLYRRTYEPETMTA